MTSVVSVTALVLQRALHAEQERSAWGSCGCENAQLVPLRLGGDDTEYKRGKFSQPLGAFLTSVILRTEGKGCCRRQCNWGAMNYSKKEIGAYLPPKDTLRNK